MRALVRSRERKQLVLRCRVCWLGFVVAGPRQQRDEMLRRAVQHYRSHPSGRYRHREKGDLFPVPVIE